MGFRGTNSGRKTLFSNGFWGMRAQLCRNTSFFSIEFGGGVTYIRFFIGAFRQNVPNAGGNWTHVETTHDRSALNAESIRQNDPKRGGY